MKKEKWIASLDGVDDAYLAAAAPKETKKKRKLITRIVALAACFSIIVGAGLWLFLPYGSSLPDVSRYEDSEYYSLIEKLNVAVNTRNEPYENNFQLYSSMLLDGFFLAGGAAPKEDMDIGADLIGTPSNDGAEMAPDYEEVTDNQVAGVIEADRIKRTSTHIYHLYGSTLSVYTVEGLDSEKVGSYSLNADFDGTLYEDECEFYITEDARRILVIAPYYSRGRGAAVRLTALDITTPSSITEISSVNIYGSYVSSRLTDGSLLFLYNYSLKSNGIDFSDPTTFVPTVEVGGIETVVPMENICAPDTLTNTRYTVIMKYDADTLASLGTYAYLSFTDDIYVSASAVYLTRSYTDETQDGKYVLRKSMTEISRLSYKTEELTPAGSVTLEGYLNDQYSLDEHEDILRAVTTTSTTRYESRKGSTNASLYWNAVTTNASLYCIDLSDMTTVAEVTAFAPEGETVKSVRFDGANAYVCTSVELSDPVFFFDLSDLANITYKDTGTIEGFSSSLVNFADGYLLGIGVGSWDTMKLEIYEEGDAGVESVAVYELDGADYARDYKAYYIDRENSIIGLGVNIYGEGAYYVVVAFDGYELHELHRECFGNDYAVRLDYMRGVLIGDFFYMLGENELKVNRIFGE